MTGGSDGPRMHFAGPAGTRDLIDLFTYHPPHGDQVTRYEEIREAGLALAELIDDLVPPSPERSTAVSRVRESVMWANAGIACNEPGPDEAPVFAQVWPVLMHLSLVAIGEEQVACGIRGDDLLSTTASDEVTCQACRAAQRAAGICVTCGRPVLPHTASGHKVTNVRPW